MKKITLGCHVIKQYLRHLQGSQPFQGNILNKLSFYHMLNDCSLCDECKIVWEFLHPIHNEYDKILNFDETHRVRRYRQKVDTIVKQRMDDSRTDVCLKSQIVRANVFVCRVGSRCVSFDRDVGAHSPVFFRHSWHPRTFGCSMARATVVTFIVNLVACRTYLNAWGNFSIFAVVLHAPPTSRRLT